MFWIANNAYHIASELKNLCLSYIKDIRYKVTEKPIYIFPAKVPYNFDVIFRKFPQRNTSNISESQLN